MSCPTDKGYCSLLKRCASLLPVTVTVSCYWYKPLDIPSWDLLLLLNKPAVYKCNELRGNMARSTQFPIMITRSTIIYEIVSPGAAGSSIYI